MDMNQKVAQKIVQDLKGVVNYNINFIDSRGMIIASSNESRIGTFHQASLLVFIEGRKVVVENDNEYEGVKEGVNLPVYFEGQIIGAVGITGKVSEVLKIDEIIRTMAEALIYQSFLKTRSRMKSYLKRQIFKQFLVYPQPDYRSLEQKAKLVDMNLNKFRRVIMCKILVKDDKIDYGTQEYIEDIYNKFKYGIKNMFHAETSLMDDMIVCLIEDVNDEKLKEAIEVIINKMKGKIKVGIGNPVESFEQLRDSYSKAEEALISLSYIDSLNYVFYNILDMEILFKEIPNEVRDEFIDRILGKMSEKDIDDYLHILETYYECNGSINRTSELLFIHKNTLQYRLNKIKEITGYNPRELKEGYVLYTALRLHKTKKQ